MLSKLAAGDEPKSILADLGFTVMRVALFSREGPSKELALLYFAAAVAFLLAGSGRFGLDFLLRGKRQDEAPQ